MLVKLLQPLRVSHIGFAAGHMLGISRVDEQDLEFARFEDLKHRNPLHARRLHGYRRNTNRGEPIRQLMQIAAEGADGSHWVLVSLRWHGHDVERRPMSTPAALGWIVESCPDRRSLSLLRGIRHLLR